MDTAISEAADRILDKLGSDTQPQLAIIFVSSIFGSQYDDVIPILRKRIPSLQHIFGCSAHSVIGGGASGPVAVEGMVSFSLTLATLPGVNIKLLHTLRGGIPEQDAAVEVWEEFTGVPVNAPGNTNFIVLADPRFMQVSELLTGLNAAYPGAAKLGGLFSTSEKSKSRAMFAWTSQQQAAQGKPDFMERSRELIQADLNMPESPLRAKQSPFGMIGSFFSKINRLVNEYEVEELVEEEQERGVFVYGAVVMALQGDVSLDVTVCQGYSDLSDKEWRVAEVADMLEGGPTAVMGLVDPADPRDGAPEVLPVVAALVHMLHDLGVRPESTPELLTQVHVAVASDPLASALNPQSYEIIPVVAITDELIMLRDTVKPGYRLKFVMRNRETIEADLRERVVALKRRELTDQLSGSTPPPALGVMVMGDVERSHELYEADGFEVQLLSSFLPLPFSGMMGTGQIGRVGSRAAAQLYEMGCVFGVLRVALPAGGQRLLPAPSESEAAPGGGEDAPDGRSATS